MSKAETLLNNSNSVVKGYGFVNHIRKESYGIVCSIAAMRGNRPVVEGESIETTKFELVAKNELVVKQLEFLKNAVKNKQKVRCAFWGLNLEPCAEPFKTKDGKEGISLVVKGDFAEMGGARIDGTIVDWAALGFIETPSAPETPVEESEPPIEIVGIGSDEDFEDEPLAA